MKTVNQLNHEAGQEIAMNWLQGCERILASGSNPLPLSEYRPDDVRVHLIGESFYEEAQAANPRWWVSQKNWPRISSAALSHARLTLRVIGAVMYPRTLSHFTKTASLSLLTSSPSSYILPA